MRLVERSLADLTVSVVSSKRQVRLLETSEERPRLLILDLNQLETLFLYLIQIHLRPVSR